jgi:hypothetical protein
MSTKEPEKEPETWIFKAIHRELVQRARIAVAVEGKAINPTYHKVGSSIC